MQLRYAPITMPWLIAAAILPAFAILYFADDDREGHPPSTVDERVAVEIANRYVSKHAPGNLEYPHLAAVLLDRRGRWEISYPLQQDYVGGGSIVTIDKQTHQIVEVRQTQ